jgi:hypothetical protein
VALFLLPSRKHVWQSSRPIAFIARCGVNPLLNIRLPRQWTERMVVLVVGGNSWNSEGYTAVFE